MIYKKESYKPSLISSKEGVYILRDGFGKIIYVGKAKNLRKRLSYYFRPSRLKVADAKFRSLVKSIASFEFIEVKSEAEALLLESRLIKEYSPQYNILLRDDKNFLLIKVNKHECYPRLILTRLRKNDGAEYFGPFPQAGALKQTMGYLNRYFGFRSCRTAIPTLEDKKYCHKHIIKHCTAPCDKSISKADYNKRVDEFLDALDGKTNKLIEQLQQKMKSYAQKQQFEKAAQTRDVVNNLNILFKQKRNFRHSHIKVTYQKEALTELKEVLNLPCEPFIIEAFDNSHFQGQYTVSSMVRFVNGKPDNKSYSRYKIKSVDFIDDFASMSEVVQRRYTRLLNEKRILPNLILIDGGKGQLSSAWQVLRKLDLSHINIIGLAKKKEEIFIPRQSKVYFIEL